MRNAYYDPKELNRKVFEHAKALGLKDWQIAQKLSITPQLITKWRRGTGSPSIDDVVQLSDIFNVTVHELLVCEASIAEKEDIAYEDLQAS